MSGVLHVVGGGVAGLACAVRAALAGREVALYEAAGHAGGRARSFVDESIGEMIDNGSHMLLGANEATRSFLADTGADRLLAEVAPACFPFLDLRTGKRWEILPTPGALPRWLWQAGRRVPGTRASDYLRDAFALARADRRTTVRGAVTANGRLYERLWQPLCRAILNSDAEQASAQLLWRVIAHTFLRGESACRPIIFASGLSATLVDPALRLLMRHGAAVRLKARLRGMEWTMGRVNALHFPEGIIRVRHNDAVVLALPPEVAGELWPDMPAPRSSHAIVNAHFHLGERVELPGGQQFLGLVGAQSHWLFARGDILSVTVSAADHLVERPTYELANLFWAEAARALGRNFGRVPAWRVIKERRATFAQTPDEVLRRPTASTALGNLFIAGDWTDTGLPATIESAVQSGFTAARLALEALAAAEAADIEAGLSQGGERPLRDHPG